MMTPEKRIKELYARQVYYGSSLEIQLNAVKGLYYYKIWAWINQGKEEIVNEDGQIEIVDKEVKALMKSGKYLGEDPLDLFQVVLDDINARKIKLGHIIPVRVLKEST